MVSVPADQVWTAILVWGKVPQWATWDDGKRVPIRAYRTPKLKIVLEAGGTKYIQP